MVLVATITPGNVCGFNDASTSTPDVKVCNHLMWTWYVTSGTKVNLRLICGLQKHFIQTNGLTYFLMASCYSFCRNQTIKIDYFFQLVSNIPGVETYCDGRNDGAQCYGALGGTVVVRLMDSASEIARYVWSNETRMILHGKKNMIVYNLIETRSSFTPSDGTFRINNLSMTDGGEYTLNIFDSFGRSSDPQTLQLTFQGK